MPGIIEQAHSYTGADPLAGFHGQPLVSDGGADSHYVGRVILELWEGPSQNDANGLAYAVDPAVGADSAHLLTRIANALPLRLAAYPPK